MFRKPIQKYYYCLILKKYFSKKRNRFSKFSIKKKKRVPIISNEFVFLLIKIMKRNIFSHVNDYNGKLLISLSIGILNVRGRIRNANYAIESIAAFLCKKLTELDKTYIICIFVGKSNLRKQRRFLKALRNKTPMHILKIQKFLMKNHNGCRPSKVRRL